MIGNIATVVELFSIVLAFYWQEDKDVQDMFLIKEMNKTYDYIVAYHSRGGYLTVSKTGNTPLPELFRKASEEFGYKSVDKNCEEQIGFSYQQSSVMNGERCSTMKAYIRPLMNRPNLHISINTMATKKLEKMNDLRSIGKMKILVKYDQSQMHLDKAVLKLTNAIPVLKKFHVIDMIKFRNTNYSFLIFAETKILKYQR